MLNEMKIEISLEEPLEKSAARYFERSKKSKRKLEGAKKALLLTKEMLLRTEKTTKQKAAVKPKPKSEWYEKFRWFFSSKNKLVILGRDATTNEIIIKKHTEKHDIVFHAETAKSPFCVVKLYGNPLDEDTKLEAAIATAAYSSAWKAGLTSSDVFMVKPEQVSKKAPSGEYLTKGAFMIYGKKEFITVQIELAIGVTKEGKIMCAPISAVQAHCDKYKLLVPGREKSSAIAKKLQKILGYDWLDDIIRALPAGGCELR